MAALSATACWSLHPPRPPVREVSMPISTLRLDNGLRVAVVVDPSANDVGVTMRYQVGAIDEPSGSAGLAHVAEHLLFETRHAGESLFARFEELATSFNAITALDATTYVSRMPPANLEAVLALEAARLRERCGSLDDAAFARELEVVRNETRQKSAAQHVYGTATAALFPAPHPYHTARATDAMLAGITRDQACRFIDAHYAPDRAVLVISGDVQRWEVEAMARRLFGEIARTPTTAPRSVPAAPRGRSGTHPVPIDERVVVVGWPLPADPVRRAQVRAVARTLRDRMAAEIEGDLGLHEHGGAGASAIAVVVRPLPGAKAPETRRAIERAIRELPAAFAVSGFDGLLHARRRAHVQLLLELDDAGPRDRRIADLVAAGADPERTLRAELDAIEGLARYDARRIATTDLALDRAAIVELTPDSPVRLGQAPVLDAPIHHEGTRRRVEDPRAARVAAPPGAHGRALDQVSIRTLRNGLRVVLQPVTRVPVVDVRLVYEVGSGDEPPGQRGISALAERGLSPHPSDWPTYLPFYEAGGEIVSRVEVDHTVFRGRGHARDLDLVLGALERLVHGGDYRSLPETAARLGRATRYTDPEIQIEAGWRTALYGYDHPYTTAGLWHQVDRAALDAAKVSAFRRAHYRLDRMTLIVTGGFDPENAVRWIEHVFVADAAPHPATRYELPATLMPVAIAVADPTRLVNVDLALPLPAALRGHALIATEMVAQAIADVRFQLAASYGLEAELVETRLATQLWISGHVDASRAAEAVALVRDRLAALRTPSEDTAARFVAARRRVLARLGAPAPSLSELAALAEQAIALGRSPVAEREADDDVRRITLDDLAGTLAGLDPARAAIGLRGPREVVQQAYAVIGRTPVELSADPPRPSR
ncbi:MAG: M16 family metallopeptidase [Kofleriaceae bacterium]